VDLCHVREELEHLDNKPNRKAEQRRLRRELRSLRFQLLVLERRLEELAGLRDKQPLNLLDELAKQGNGKE
jgi:hypothetical protein